MNALQALMEYQQADHDGIMVLTSRQAIHEVHDALIEREAELIYLRKHGHEGALWSANHSKDVWRDMAREALT